jgi:hypothetical protein
VIADIKTKYPSSRRSCLRAADVASLDVGGLFGVVVKAAAEMVCGFA